MNVLQTRTTFERQAVKLGLRVAGVASAGENRDWVSRALASNAELRLVWRTSSESLRLEISQGPGSGPHVGWIVLYSETCKAAILPTQEECETLESAMTHGFELMGISGSSRGA